jgi:uncharacterized repeat protein (TIGR03803 family)
MRNSKLSIVVFAMFGMGMVTSAVATFAQQETVLHSFHTGSGGHNPIAGVTFDSSGNLYGTTEFGGPSTCTKDTGGCGVLFKLSPTGAGAWAEKVIHNFGSGSDGYSPASGVILDSAGNLYGVTTFGGTGSCSCGTVYEFVRAANGSFSEKELYAFKGGENDGAIPFGALVFDSVGNLYGTTVSGGSTATGDGTVFELSPASNGTWTEKILHTFGKTTTDGRDPLGTLVFDAKGNLYGTTVNGGTHPDPQSGTAFRFKPKSGGGWSYSIIFNLGGSPSGPATPNGGLIVDAAGNLYGSTLSGGKVNAGTVFELLPQSNGSWSEKVLHTFDGTDGSSPNAPLIMDAAGNLFGSTFSQIGGELGLGTAFELIPSASGSWTLTTLHTFGDGPDDGQEPVGGMIFDSSGNLYGATFNGGSFGNDCPAVGPSCGTVFEITP